MKALVWLTVCVGCLLGWASPVQAQFGGGINHSNWWRNGATLDLDFVNNRYYISGTSVSNLTSLASLTALTGVRFSRTSSATFVNASGVLQTAAANVARLAWETSGTGIPLGVLIEDTRTNLVRNSTILENLSNVTSNIVIAPDGTSTADLLYEYTTNTRHFTSMVGGIVSNSLNTSVTYSIFAKAQGRNFAYLWGGLPGTPFTRIGLVANLTTGEVFPRNFSAPVSVISRRAEKLANGWWRLSVSGIASATAVDTYLEFGVCSTSINCNGYLGNGASGVAFWGGQIEEGDTPTSYIPTNSSAVTRAAEVFSISTTLNGGWSTDGQGTIMATAQTNALKDNGLQALIGLSDGTSNNGVFMFLGGDPFYNPSRLRYEIWVGGVSLAGALCSSSNYTLGRPMKQSYAFQSGSARGSISGALCGASTPTLPTMTRLLIGAARFSGSNLLNGWVRRVTYFPTREPDHTLEDYTR